MLKLVDANGYTVKDSLLYHANPKEYLIERRPCMFTEGSYRWIIYPGWLVEETPEQIAFLSPISARADIFPNDAEHIYIGTDHALAVFLLNKLNSEWAKKEGGLSFRGTWQAHYAKTHDPKHRYNQDALAALLYALAAKE